MLRGYCTTGMEKKQCLATQGFRHRENALRHIVHLYKSKALSAGFKHGNKKIKIVCKEVRKKKRTGMSARPT